MTDVKDIVVEIEKEPALPDTEVVVSADLKPEKKTEDAPAKNEDFESLRRQLEALTEKEKSQREGRERAEQAVRDRQKEVLEARRETSKAKEDVVDGQYHTIVAAIQAANTEAEAAVAEQEAALIAGDLKKASEAQRKIARAEARLVHFEDGKAALEYRMEAAKEAAKNPPPQPQSNVDPVEAQLARYTPRTQDWIREHTEVLTDTKLNRRAMAAHLDAEADGYVPDTDAYFQYLDKRLGYAEEEAEKPETKITARQPVRRLAPVSRDTNVSAGRLNGERVKLSSSEVDMADQLGLTHAEYARRKLIMTKEGRYATMVVQ